MICEKKLDNNSTRTFSHVFILFFHIYISEIIKRLVWREKNKKKTNKEVPKDFFFKLKWLVKRMIKKIYILFFIL